MFRILAAVVFTCTMSITAAEAQTISELERSRSNMASFYNYSEPADVTMLVNVWGTVRNPGLYEVPQDLHLSRLLSLSGGPIVSPRQNRQDRTIQVRLFRDGPSGRELLFETEMQNEVLASVDDPLLLDGDVITVETVVRQRFSWRDAFPIIAAIGTVAIALERLAR